MSKRHIITYTLSYIVLIGIISFGFSYQRNQFSFPALIYTASIKNITTENSLHTAQENALTIEQKIEQLFIMGFDGTTPTDAKNLIEKHAVGGVILLEKNISNPQQIQELTKQLQTTSVEKTGLPILIGIDQEGGEVSRISFTGFNTISQRDILDNNQAYTIAKQRGDELHNLGINLNFSPVLDVITNQESFLSPRVFTGTIQHISELGSAMVTGYTDAHIQSCPKHFPGHGDALNDPHVFDSINDENKEEIQKNAQSFMGAITAHTPCLMIGHTTYKNIDTDPASKSSIIITNWLRSLFNFNGVILTDDMEMVAAQNHQTLGEAALSSLQSGADMVLISGYTTTLEEREVAIKYITEQIQNNAIPISKLDEKISRILKMKDDIK